MDHIWADKEFDWGSLYKAVNYVSGFCKRWGRLGGQSKEKYGTLRFYADFGFLCLHGLVYPGYVYCQFPKWLWKMDIRYIGPFLKKIGLNRLFVKWQSFIYRKAYINACKKWPHIQAEILQNMDYPKLLPKSMIKEEKNKYHILDLQGNIVATWVTYGKEE